MIELSNYQEFNTQSHRAGIYARIQKICNLLARFADAVATLSIGVCTIFCMYLAYTML